jgi:hypothetical protein
VPELVQDLGVTVENPELTLDAGVLRELNHDLRPAAVEFEVDISRSLQLTEATIVETSVDVELPTSLAGPAGKALRALDVAWRLAYVFADLDESRLHRSGWVSLDELVPAAYYGLVVEEVELASFKSKLRAIDRNVRRIGPYVGILASATTIGLNVEKAVAVTQPQKPPAICALPTALQDPSPHRLGELPGLPPGATARLKATLPGDRHIYWPPESAAGPPF